MNTSYVATDVKKKRKREKKKKGRTKMTGNERLGKRPPSVTKNVTVPHFYDERSVKSPLPLDKCNKQKIKGPGYCVIQNKDIIM